MYIEFTDETLVVTESGFERLTDLLDRPVRPVLWAIQWKFHELPNGISFHGTHRNLKDFVNKQIDSKPEGPARLIYVSDWLANYVNEHHYCWTNLLSFDEALTYGGEKCSH